MKHTSAFFLVIAFAGLLFSACSSNNAASTATDKQNVAPFDLTAMKKVIEEKNNQFTKAHITGDTTFLNHIFTHDARVFPPNSTLVTGYDAIAALNLQWVNYGIKEFREDITALYGNEDYLIEEGIYYGRYGKDNIVDSGKYIDIWKKEGGDWKICSNIWNANAPATPIK